MSVDNNNQISTFRRLLPQVLVTFIKNLIVVNKTVFDGLASLVIPALLGISTTLNPDETIRITGVESSWLSSLIYIGHPFGSILSGFLSDALGRRRALMLVMVPAVTTFIALGMAESFWIVCLAFFIISFIFGLKDAPATVYISEISEKSFRGVLLSFTPIASALGHFVVYLIGSFFSWRQLSLIISMLPIIIIIAIFFIPETPNWLLSKGRPNDALKSMQWLRGWVSSDVVNDEFTKLQTHNTTSTACIPCMEHSVPCQHSKATKFYDKIMELKQKCILKPCILAISLNFFMEISVTMVLRPYIIQVIKSYGIPLDANFMATILSACTVAGNCCFLLSVGVFGKRRFYLISATSMVLCSTGLSIYGFVLLPSNWISFNDPLDSTVPDFDRIRDTVGNYGYLALALFVTMYFFSSAFGFNTVPVVMTAEVFPFRLRSFLCGLAYTFRYLFAAVGSKSYYNVEIWLTLPGAVLFYGMISLIGLIVMYFILPETEKRSLEDIEAHYTDNTKKITDIHIPMSSK